jgi:hypothetical protein
VIKEVSALLLPFKAAQKLLEGEKYVNISWKKANHVKNVDHHQ